ncbi:MAG: hypothetical protein E6I96_05840 [Chloroflexi bacterium]|nr:MAG: hypothetical protein E6I96_05840 [Chloroflexota bacterium]
MSAAAEVHRRLLLAESDFLLDEVETLRLNDRSDAPQPLREAIRALQIRLGRRNPPVAPATIDAAQDLVFAVQQRLMALNPKNPSSRAAERSAAYDVGAGGPKVEGAHAASTHHERRGRRLGRAG